MDLVALLTEVALKFASLPGSRFAWIVCHVGRLMRREQELQELCVHVLLRGLGFFLGFPSRCRVGFCLIIPHFMCVISCLAAVIPHSIKVSPFSGVSSVCCWFLPLYLSTAVLHRCESSAWQSSGICCSCPSSFQSFRKVLPNSLCGGVLPVQREPARPSTQAPFLQCSIPMNLPFPYLSLLQAFDCPCIRVGRSHPSLSLLRAALPFYL